MRFEPIDSRDYDERLLLMLKLWLRRVPLLAIAKRTGFAPGNIGAKAKEILSDYEASERARP